jgi:hypothetical protein
VVGAPGDDAEAVVSAQRAVPARVPEATPEQREEFGGMRWRDAVGSPYTSCTGISSPRTSSLQSYGLRSSAPVLSMRVGKASGSGATAAQAR